MTRTRRSNLERLEAATGDDKPLVIPPDARVRVDFNTPVDTSTLLTNESQYPDDLAALAAEMDDNEPPLDPMLDFCNTWSRFDGYNLYVTRLPDPAAKRMPGHTYNRTCLELESLGTTPFDPHNLQASLQFINGSSGGVFRFWLLDESGKPIPDAHVSRIAINDPATPKQATPTPAQYTPPPKPEPSALELRLQGLQERLLENALTRIMTPPEPPALPPPQSNINDEDRLTLMLVREGGVMPKVISNINTLIGSPDGVSSQKQSWSDWLKETGGELLKSNPEISERITNTAANLVYFVLNRLPDLSNLSQQPPPIGTPSPQQLNPYSGGRIEPLASQGSAPTGLPEAPEADDEDDEENLDDITMIILEELIGLLSGSEPLRADHPVFVDLLQRYPVVFKQAITLIATQPLDSIVAWVKSKSPLYASMFDSPATGPHYRQRLQELQALCQTPPPQPSSQPPQSSTSESNIDATPNEKDEQAQSVETRPPTRRRHRAP